MTLEEILWALTNCDVATRHVKVSYEAVEAIAAKLRAAEELAGVLDKWDNGFISGREARKKVKAAKEAYRAAGGTK